MYQDNNAYAFDKFELHEREVKAASGRAEMRNTARVPAKKPDVQMPDIRRVEPKTRSQKNSEAKRTSLRALFLMVFLGAVFLSVCTHIGLVARHHELTSEISAIEAQIENAKSENVRLNAELNGITSITKIDNYATNILGMTKLEKYQVECINMSNGDKVLYAGGSVVDNTQNSAGSTADVNNISAENSSVPAQNDSKE